MRAGSTQSATVAQAVPLGPVDFAIFSLKSLVVGCSRSVFPKFTGHFVVKILAVDVGLLKNPVAKLAVGVREERVGALGAELKAIISEACITMTNSMLSNLLTLTVVVTSFGASLVGALAAESAFTSIRIHSVPSLALAAVRPCEREPAQALPGAFEAACSTLPVAETARSADF